MSFLRKQESRNSYFNMCHPQTLRVVRNPEVVPKGDHSGSRRVGACLPPSQRQGQALPLREVTAKVLIRTEAEMWSDQTYETASPFLTTSRTCLAMIDC
jgi:hypothetical protein